MSALGAVDAALWDIAGKHYGAPSYKLMGGAVRDRIRVYAHWGIRDLSDEGLEPSRKRLDMLREAGLHGVQGRPRRPGAPTSRPRGSTSLSRRPT